MFFRTKTNFLARFLLISFLGLGAQTALSASENETSEAPKIFVHQIEVDRVLSNPVSNLSSLDQEDFFVLTSKVVVGTKTSRSGLGRNKIQRLEEENVGSVLNDVSSDLVKFQPGFNCLSWNDSLGPKKSLVFVGTPAFGFQQNSFPVISSDPTSSAAFFSKERITSVHGAGAVVPTPTGFEKNCPFISFRFFGNSDSNAKFAMDNIKGEFPSLPVFASLRKNLLLRKSDSSNRESGDLIADSEFSLKISERSELRPEENQRSTEFNVGWISTQQTGNGRRDVIAGKILSRPSRGFKRENEPNLINSKLSTNKPNSAEPASKKFEMLLRASDLLPTDSFLKASTNGNFLISNAAIVGIANKRFFA